MVPADIQSPGIRISIRKGKKGTYPIKVVLLGVLYCASLPLRDLRDALKIKTIFKLGAAEVEVS